MNQVVKVRPVSIVDLRDYSCRFPIGDPRKEGFGYCGVPSDVGKSYCGTHQALSYQPRTLPIEIASRRAIIAEAWTDQRDHHALEEQPDEPIELFRQRAPLPVRLVVEPQKPCTLHEIGAARTERQARYAANAVERQNLPAPRTTDDHLRDDLATFSINWEAEQKHRLDEEKRRFHAEYQRRIEDEDFSPLRNVWYPSIRRIIRIVAKHYGVTPLDVISHRRTGDVVRPRQVVAYLCRTTTLRSLPDIARQIGGRDHSTILSSIRKIQRLIDEGDADLRAIVEFLKSQIAPEAGNVEAVVFEE